jgi:hypothetical protein
LESHLVYTPLQLQNSFDRGDGLIPAALLLASHDRLFLERLTTINWQIEPDKDGIGLSTAQQ